MHGHHFDGREGFGRVGCGWSASPPGRGGHKGPFGGGGPGDPFGGGGFGRFARHFFQHGTRARRGDIRAAILALLAEQPRNGYQLMQEIEKRSHGAWRPSSGSVYPTLQQLEDERLVRTEEAQSGRTFQLTPDGQAYVRNQADELRAPWELDGDEGDDRERMADLGRSIFDLVAAAKQVSGTRNKEHQEAAKKILKDARRALYRLLAEDDEGDEDGNDA